MTPIFNLKNMGGTGKTGLAGLGIIGVLAGYIAGYAMHWGPLAYSDSVGYLEVAHNILVGNGPISIKGSGRIVQFITHPPFYSYVLALLSLTGQPLVQSAKLLNILLLAFFVFGTGFSFFILTRRALLSIAVSLTILLATVIVTNFTSAMSEPVFFCLGFAGLFLLLFYFRSKRTGLIWVAGVLMGLSFISRFTGAAMMAAGAAVLLIFSAKPPLKRLLDALIYAIICLIPFGIYKLYLTTIGGYLGLYTIPPYAEFVTLLRSGTRTLVQIVINWLPWGSQIGTKYPRHHGIFLIALVLVGLACLAVVLLRQGKSGLRSIWEKANFQLGITFGLFSLIYAVFVMATFLFVQNPKPILDERVFSPLLVGGVLSAAALADFCLEPFLASTPRQILLTGVMAIFMIANISPTRDYVQSMHLTGIGYTSKTWQRSPTIKAVEGLPADVHIISDNIDAIMFYTYRSASRIPELESKTPQPIDQAFGEDQNDVVQSMFRNGQAVLVLFNQAYSQFDAIYGGQTTQTRIKAFTNGLYPYYQGADGAIYYYSAPK